MEQKQQLISLVTDSDLPRDIQMALVKYISTVASVDDKVTEDVAIVFEAYADVAQAMADNSDGLANLEEQIIDRLEKINAERDNRLQAIVDEISPKVEELSKQAFSMGESGPAVMPTAPVSMASVDEMGNPVSGTV